MSVLFQINNISKRHGAQVLLNEASASFARNQKIGMIGRNGTGKSTLCKIITGQEEADSGTISRNSELRLSYLEQHDPFKYEETVSEFLTRYTGKEEWECAEMAGHFQLKNEILETKLGQLPGGVRTRAKLTAMLLSDPNFLILDEPTNYLDLSTLVLLENFLQDFSGGFVIVSHDREFLKKTCTHTLEIENGRLTFYPGPIEAYFEFKEEQKEHVLAYNKGVETKKKQLQEFVDRFKARASTATRAKSKMKQIEKLKTIEIEHALGTAHIEIPPVEKKAGVAIACEDLVIGYPEREVARNIRFDIDRGAHVAVLGDNGQGKTTFLKTVAGELAPKEGKFRWGIGLKIAYYAQHVFATLYPEDDVYGHLQKQAAAGITQQEILNLAGSFLFKGDDVRKKVSVLSGGERARLCLAGLLLTRSHVLLLDEPTNHLDFETVEALGEALKQFAGTIFFISHDRTFVNLIATNIIEVKNGSVKRYPGRYEDYVYHLENSTREELMHDGYIKTKSPNKKQEPKSAGRDHHSEANSSKPADSGQQKTDEASSQKEIKAEIHQLNEKIKKSEQRMTHFKKEKQDLLDDLAKNPFFYSKERNKKIADLDASMGEEENTWLELQEKLEKLKKRQ